MRSKLSASAISEAAGCRRVRRNRWAVEANSSIVPAVTSSVRQAPDPRVHHGQCLPVALGCHAQPPAAASAPACPACSAPACPAGCRPLPGCLGQLRGRFCRAASAATAMRCSSGAADAARRDHESVGRADHVEPVAGVDLGGQQLELQPLTGALLGQARRGVGQIATRLVEREHAPLVQADTRRWSRPRHRRRRTPGRGDTRRRSAQVPAQLGDQPDLGEATLRRAGDQLGTLDQLGHLVDRGRRRRVRRGPRRHGRRESARRSGRLLPLLGRALVEATEVLVGVGVELGEPVAQHHLRGLIVDEQIAVAVTDVLPLVRISSSIWLATPARSDSRSRPQRSTSASAASRSSRKRSAARGVISRLGALAGQVRRRVEHRVLDQCSDVVDRDVATGDRRRRGVGGDPHAAVTTVSAAATISGRKRVLRMAAMLGRAVGRNRRRRQVRGRAPVR